MVDANPGRGRACKCNAVQVQLEVVTVPYLLVLASQLEQQQLERNTRVVACLLLYEDYALVSLGHDGMKAKRRPSLLRVRLRLQRGSAPNDLGHWHCACCVQLPDPSPLVGSAGGTASGSRLGAATIGETLHHHDGSFPGPGPGSRSMPTCRGTSPGVGRPGAASG
jgi:hypothetical protein